MCGADWNEISDAFFMLESLRLIGRHSWQGKGEDMEISWVVNESALAGFYGVEG